MLSTTSGFTPGQVQRFRSMFFVLLIGVVILMLGVGILCFGRMYGFDSSRYDLFMVFGVIIVTIAAVAITVPVCCQVRIYMEVRRDSKGDEIDYGPMGTLPAGTGGYMYRQPQQMPVTQHHSQLPFSSAALAASGPLTKRRLTVDNSSGEVLASFRFLKRLYRTDTSPKMLLHTHCQFRDLAAPEYKTDYIDRLYYSQVTVDGKVYRNLLGDQSKRYAEHGAACICLVHLGLSDGRKDEELELQKRAREQLEQQQQQQQQQQNEKPPQSADGDKSISIS